ncbi:MAG: ACT domain-containing protein, partial [Butyricicoccaceae bacterium]
LLGLEPDDIKIRTSLEIAHREKRDFTIDWSEEEVSHPNTAKIQVENSDGKNFEIIGSSVGGGNIEIQKVNGMEVSFSCSHPTLLVFHQDQPGVIAAVTGSLAIHRINVAFMKVFRHSKRQHACMAIETDETVVPELIDYIKRLSPEITEVCAL